MPNANLLKIFALAASPDFARIHDHAGDLIEMVLNRPGMNSLLDRFERSSKTIFSTGFLVRYMMEGPLASGNVDIDDIHLVHLLGLWVFFVGDYMEYELDPKETSGDEVGTWIRGLMTHVREGTSSDDDIVDLIVAVTNAFRGRDSWADFGESWHMKHLEGFLQAMLREYRLRGGDERTTLEEYRDFAAESIGLHLTFGGAALALGEASYSNCIKELDTLVTMAADALRLAGDVRSFRKKIEEGKTTSVALAATKFEIPNDKIMLEGEDVLRILRAFVEADLMDLHNLLSFIGPESDPMRQMIVKGLVGMLSLFEQGNFHTVGVEA